MPVQKPFRTHSSLLRKHRQSLVDCSQGRLLRAKVKLLELSVPASWIMKDGSVPREGMIPQGERY